MTAKQLTDSILQLAIQGKLVPQDPNDEPASILLEKIRGEKRRLVEEKVLKKKDLEETPVSEDEKPFEIPESWVWCRVNDLFLHASGKQQSANNKKVGTLQKYITTSNLYWGRFVLENLKEMYFSSEEMNTCSATKGDLLVCEGGAGYGRSAIWEYDYDICLQNHVHRLRPVIRGICNYVYFLIYYLKDTNQLASVGMAMPGLSANRLKSLLVPLPPLAEQHRIVERIEEILPFVKEYGEAYDEASKMDAELPEKLKKSILQEAIKGKLGTQDPTDEPAKVLLEQIREEKKKLVKEGVLKKKDLLETPVGEDEIPQIKITGWEYVKLPFVTSLIDGTKQDGEFVCLDAKFLRGKSSGEKLTKGKFVKKGDNIILVDGENSGEVFTVPCEGYMGSTFKQLWTSQVMYLPYVLFFIRSCKDMLRNSKKGAAIPHLNKEIFNNLVIGIPPLAEQHRIVEKIEALFAEIDNMTINNDINETEIEETEE